MQDNQTFKGKIAYSISPFFFLIAITILGCQNEGIYVEESNSSASEQAQTRQPAPTAIFTQTPKITPIPEPTPTPKREGVRVSKVSFGEKWPLTVSSGWVSARSCKPNPFGSGKISQRVFIDEDGKVYALNGFALQEGYPHIHEITRQVSPGIYDGGGLWELSKVAERLCN